jgi:hypothetical protein
VNRLPDQLLPRSSRLTAGADEGGTELEDDGAFEAAVVNACGFWLISTTVQLLPEACESTGPGISTLRQRLLHRYRLYSQLAARSGRPRHSAPGRT